MPPFEDRLWEAISQTAQQAAFDVSDRSWDRDTVASRVTKHVWKASQKFSNEAWEGACADYVTKALGTLHASLQSPEGALPDWFWQMDFLLVFAESADMLLTQQGVRLKLAAIQEVVQAECQAFVDRAHVDTNIWQVCGALFRSEKVVEATRRGLQKAWEPAFLAAIDNKHLEADVLQRELPMEIYERRVEDFLQKWLEDAMQRAYASFENCNEIFDEEVCTELIRMLIAPQGEEHWATCIPGGLTEIIGRPPVDWDAIADIVTRLFASWQGSRGRGRKKRKTADDFAWGDGAEAGEPQDEEEGGEHVEVFSAFGSAPAPTQRHPVGRSAARLVPRAPAGPPPRGKGPGKGAGVPRQDNGRGKAGKGAGKGAARAAQQKAEVLAEEYADNLLEEAAELPEGGHELCTSQVDCIGHPGSRLIRHLHDGKPADIYCEHCWASFTDRNPTLEGEEVTM